MNTVFPTSEMTVSYHRYGINECKAFIQSLTEKEIKMKRIITVLLLLTLALSVCACNGGADSKKDYEFKAAGVTLKIGDAASVIDALGSPIAKDESESCGGIPGVDVVYLFVGFKVYTTPAKSGNVINKIEVTDDSVKTPEGVFVGMEKKLVTSAMGAPTTESATSLVYEGEAMKLTFILRDSIVTNIQYVAK
jgi:hypothetical protein